VKAIVYQGKRDVRVTSVPDAVLADERDAIVRVTRTAICGSDLHLYHGGLEGTVGTEPGFAIGHEFVGVVEETGRGLDGLRKGDRVLAACTVGCGRCPSCRRGVFSGCAAMGGRGASNVFGFSHELPGGQAEAVRVPFADATLFKVPSQLSDEQVLFLTDILPTGYLGADLAEVGPGDTVVVFGCGPVGTFALMSALLRGAARVIAVDLDEGRLARARDRGCTTIDGRTEDVSARVLELTHGEGADCAIEAVGRVELITQAATVVRHGGRVAVIGVLTEPVAALPWFLLFMKNLSLRTGLVNPQVYIPKLLPLIETGRIDPTQIVTHRLPLSDGPRGYEVFDGHEENVLKVVLTP
jgi:threonine dehydrogenase-like Zn-dependent dehydrogenase